MTWQRHSSNSVIMSPVKPAATFGFPTVETGEHHITVPAHNPLKIGTLAAILADLESHHKLTREELLRRLFS